MRACVRVYIGDSSPEFSRNECLRGRGKERECVCVTRNYAYIYYINIYHCAREKKSCKSETS